MSDWLVLVATAAVVLLVAALRVLAARRSAFRRSPRCRRSLQGRPAPRRFAPKPPWVRREVLRLKAWMPQAGCRTIAHAFNRLHGERRQMTVGKTFVADPARPPATPRAPPAPASPVRDRGPLGPRLDLRCGTRRRPARRARRHRSRLARLPRAARGRQQEDDRPPATPARPLRALRHAQGSPHRQRAGLPLEALPRRPSAARRPPPADGALRALAERANRTTLQDRQGSLGEPVCGRRRGRRLPTGPRPGSRLVQPPAAAPGPRWAHPSRGVERKTSGSTAGASMDFGVGWRSRRLLLAWIGMLGAETERQHQRVHGDLRSLEVKRTEAEPKHPTGGSDEPEARVKEVNRPRESRPLRH